MSYRLDLNEMSEASLLGELTRRANLRAANKCDYCERPVGARPSCKFPERHNREPICQTCNGTRRIEGGHGDTDPCPTCR